MIWNFQTVACDPALDLYNEVSTVSIFLHAGVMNSKWLAWDLINYFLSVAPTD